MRKLVIVAAMVLGFALAASAQPRAIGFRGTYGAEVSYQHILGNGFIEADLGFVGNVPNFAATYNIIFAKPQWTSRGDWNAYAGPGAVIGSMGGFHFAAAAQVGIEYTFWFPLQLSVDIRPQLGLNINQGNSPFHAWGYWPCIGARYVF